MKNLVMRFVTSVANDKLYQSDLPQIAVCGKSNVGKSSLINALCNQKGLAKTSKQAGRTRLINYFEASNGFLLVDLPGYGYSKAGKEQSQKWGALIENYLINEKQLKHIFLLVDIRHGLGANDAVLYNFLFKYNLPFTIIATKSDKLAKTRIKPQLRQIAAQFLIGENNIIAVSAQTRQNIDKLIERIQQIVVQPQLTDDSTETDTAND